MLVSSAGLTLELACVYKCTYTRASPTTSPRRSYATMRKGVPYTT